MNTGWGSGIACKLVWWVVFSYIVVHLHFVVGNHCWNCKQSDWSALCSHKVWPLGTAKVDYVLPGRNLIEHLSNWYVPFSTEVHTHLITLIWDSIVVECEGIFCAICNTSELWCKCDEVLIGVWPVLRNYSSGDWAVWQPQKFHQLDMLKHAARKLLLRALYTTCGMWICLCWWIFCSQPDQHQCPPQIKRLPSWTLYSPPVAHAIPLLCTITCCMHSNTTISHRKCRSQNWVSRIIAFTRWRGLPLQAMLWQCTHTRWKQCLGVEEQGFWKEVWRSCVFSWVVHPGELYGFQADVSPANRATTKALWCFVLSEVPEGCHHPIHWTQTCCYKNTGSVGHSQLKLQCSWETCYPKANCRSSCKTTLWQPFGLHGRVQQPQATWIQPSGRKFSRPQNHCEPSQWQWIAGKLS